MCKLVRKVTPTKNNNNIQGICQSIPRPQHGYMRCTRKKINGKFPSGTKCKLKCRKGYEPSGYMRKKCTEIGMWMGTDATCEEESKLITTTTRSVMTAVRSHIVIFIFDGQSSFFLGHPTDILVCIHRQPVLFFQR